MTYGEADCFRTPPEKLISKNPDPYTDPFTMGFPTTRHLVHTVNHRAKYGDTTSNHYILDRNKGTNETKVYYLWLK